MIKIRTALFRKVILCSCLILHGISYDQTFAQKELCKFSELPDDVKVYAVGVHEGIDETDVILEFKSGHNAKSVDVIINKPSESIILVLMSPNPVIWTVKWTSETKILGVILGGFFKQALLGIPRSIPVLYATRNNDMGCPFLCTYKDDDLDNAIVGINKITGKDLNRLFIRDFRGKFYIGSHKDLTKNDLLFSNDFKIKDYTDIPKLPSGQKGLDLLMSQNAIRLATQTEIDTWTKKARQKNKSGEIIHSMRYGHTYVILKKITLPNDLYGPYSKSFIILKGSSIPNDSKGHNTFYFMDTGDCTGVMCRNRF